MSQELKSRLRALVSSAESKAAMTEGKLQQAETTLTSLEDDEVAAQEAIAVGEQALQVLQALEHSWQRSFEETLANTVSEGLSLVMNDTLTLEINSKMRGDTPTVEFRLVQGDLVTDIMEAKGGGVVVLTSFLFRVLVTLAVQPALRRTLLLDESFAHLSPEYRPAAAALLKKLSTDAGMQMILVTQEPEYLEVADIAYEARQEKGITTFHLLKDHQDACYDA